MEDFLKAQEWGMVAWSVFVLGGGNGGSMCHRILKGKSQKKSKF